MVQINWPGIIVLLFIGFFGSGIAIWEIVNRPFDISYLLGLLGCMGLFALGCWGIRRQITGSWR